MTQTLQVISAGAAKGLVEALQKDFERELDVTLDARFGAVGAMKDLLLQGSPCDLLILTQKLLEDLARDGLVQPASIRPLGRVYTGIAIPAGQSRPRIDDGDALAQALLDATSIFFPDPERATAGIHFVDVMAKLGLRERLAPRLRPYPNGATAMREMARSGDPRAIGCTQVTEILYTPGVELVGLLPKTFELATLYSVSVCTRAKAPQTAQRLLDLLTGKASEALRSQGGFEPA